MLTRALARPATAAAGLACLAAFALAGCSGQDDADPAPVSRATTSSAPATPDETTSSSTASSATPSQEPSESAEVTQQPAESPAEGPDLAGRLLGADEVPGFNQEYRWTEGATRTREPGSLFGTCQRFAMTSIGATDVAVRDYRPEAAGAQDTAGELVAEFPDNATARRAFEVLKSWRAKCAGQLKGFDRPDVGGLEDVGVDGGTGGWYLLVYGPAAEDQNAGYFDAQGMALVGSRIAMVELVAVGQDYNYEPGQEPAVAAVQRAAAKLS